MGEVPIRARIRGVYDELGRLVDQPSGLGPEALGRSGIEGDREAPCETTEGHPDPRRVAPGWRGEARPGTPPGDNLGQALNAATARLARAGIESARLDARLLAAHALGWDAAKVAATKDFFPDAEQRWTLEVLITRREAREPVAAIIGRCEFWSLNFAVNADVLIPRPDSETIIEAALAAAEDGDENKDGALGILDLGTGSGCLLLALLSELPLARGLGVDISEAALSVAASNARNLGLGGRAAFELSDWGDNVTGGIPGRFDIVVVNPPYIADGEFAALEPEVARFEPRLALSGGADGLDCTRALAPRLGPLLAPGGRAFVEIRATQADAVAALLKARGLRVCQVHKDLAGRSRVVEAENIF